jgi:hypothetical protein
VISIFFASVIDAAFDDELDDDTVDVVLCDDALIGIAMATPRGILIISSMKLTTLNSSAGS